MTKPVLIVGASMAGLRTAEALRRFGYAGPITAIGDERHAPYNRPPLSKEVLSGDEVTFESVAFPQRAATADVNWVLGNPAVSADLSDQKVTTADGQVFEYSNLVIATGLRPKQSVFANNLQVGRHVIRSLDDAVALRNELKSGARVVVLGAGFIGCETAATATKLGCDVTIVAPSQLPIQRILGDELAAEVMRRQRVEGVEFAMGRRVTDLVGAVRIQGVLLDNGTT
ncbi:MAG: NAD(P)/FAD-dependent oxidoreductase, partial [Actinomycetes bacterium]